MTAILDLIAKHNLTLVRASGNKGGELHGPCPACGGTDRFHVWPEQGRDGTFWCRQCGIAGDAIQFLRDVDGLSFPEACAALDRQVPDKDRPRPSAPRPSWQPDQPPAPPEDLWQERSQALVTWAGEHLARNAAAREWLAVRGITPDTARRFHLGWNPGENGRDIYRPRESWGLPPKLKDDGRPTKLWLPQGLVIPWHADGRPVRLRIRRPEGEPKYYIIPGSSSAPMAVPPARSTARGWVVVESELDAVLLAGVVEAAGLDVGVLALGTATRKPDAQVAALLRSAVAILLALDFDQAGNSALRFWEANFPRAKHWPPVMGKDPGEDLAAGVDLAEWLRAGLPPAFSADLRPAQVDPLPPKSLDCSGGGAEVPVSEERAAEPPADKLPGKPHPSRMTAYELAEVQGMEGVDLLERLLRACVQDRLYAVANDGDGCGTRACNQCWKFRRGATCDLPAQVGALVCNNPLVWQFVNGMPDGRYHPMDRYAPL